MKIKYLTSVMFGHAKTQDVVTEILKELEKLATPLKLMFSLRMDGPKCTEQAKPDKRRKAIIS